MAQSPRPNPCWPRESRRSPRLELLLAGIFSRLQPGLASPLRGLSQKFHVEVKLTEELLNNFAFSQFEKHRDEAMAAFKLSVQLHSDSPGVYDTLGQAYEEGGQAGSGEG
jgi:hypothetical protein